jgi:hypothetical protein
MKLYKERKKKKGQIKESLERPNRISFALVIDEYNRHHQRGKDEENVA